MLHYDDCNRVMAFGARFSGAMSLFDIMFYDLHVYEKIIGALYSDGRLFYMNILKTR